MATQSEHDMGYNGEKQQPLDYEKKDAHLGGGEIEEGVVVDGSTEDPQ